MTKSELLQLVYDRFRSSGSWPFVSDLRVELRHEGNIRVLATEIGADNIVCENRDGGVCRLHFPAIAECQYAEEDVNNVLAAFRFLARQYITDRARTVGSAEIVTALMLPQLTGMRMCRILPTAATEVWASYTNGEDASFVNMKLLEGIVPYESVTTFAQFVTISERVRQEALIVAGITLPTPSIREELNTATRASIATSTAASAAVSNAMTPPPTDENRGGIWSLLHPSVVSVAKSRFEAGYFADSVESALKLLDTEVRNKSAPHREHKDGAKLMMHVFGPDRPILALGDLDTASGKSEQVGYTQLFAGAMTGIRNPKAHAVVSITAERALHHLFLASLLFEKLDEATRVTPPTQE